MTYIMISGLATTIVIIFVFKVNIFQKKKKERKKCLLEMVSRKNNVKLQKAILILMQLSQEAKPKVLSFFPLYFLKVFSSKSMNK